MIQRTTTILGRHFKTNYRFIPVPLNKKLSSATSGSTSTSTDGKSDEKPESTNESEDAVKTRILNAALPFVPELNWSRQAIEEGAKSLGYPSTTHGMFPRGEAELVQHFYTLSNTQLVEHLEQLEESLKLKKSNEIAHLAIKYRLSLIIPYINKWPSAIAIMAIPQNAPAALSNLLTLADDICHYAGDKSTNSMWYVRRVGIAGIYKMTELYMMQDKSLEYQQTWEFLTNRINEAKLVNDVYKQSENTSHAAVESLKSALIFARNMLGLSKS